jgi:hypothetical protein
MRKRWLAGVPWEMVVWQNERLCAAKNAHHGPTAEGHETTRKLWESSHREEMDLGEVVELCRECHRLAPFTNFNGNTFAAIARTLVDQVDVAAERRAVARSLAGHIVAGVASADEVKAFQEFCASLGQR